MLQNENKLTEKIAIITDSCADIPPKLLKEYPIFIIPMQINCRDGIYRDGVEITADEIYEKLKTELPKTSSPLGEDIIDVFQKVKHEGYTHAIVITLAGALSGTVNHIRLAAENESDLKITVFDSKQGSIGIGAIALQAAQYVKEGIGYEALLDKISHLIENTKVFFSIQTLEYLQKGGRIGKAAAIAGTMLQIKPILSFESKAGEIYAAAKVRGRKVVEAKLLKLLQEYVDEKGQGKRSYNLMVADGGAPEERAVLEERLRTLFPNYKACFQAKIGAALSVYLGPGLLGVGIQFLDE